MNTKSNYSKVASYEVKESNVDKILLLYSGGLDTSTMLKWLQDNYKAEVTTLTLDIGQQEKNLEEVKAKALKLGAKNAYILDAKDDFAEKFISKGILANASYQGDYHLSTPMGRAVTSAKAVEFAEKLGIKVLAHGCTGKGNDQVRFDGYITTLNPELKIIAPVREWNMSRPEQIEYANQNNIPVNAKPDFPYSVDDNMWGMTWEGGEIENPNEINKIEKFLTTYTLAEKAPNEPEIIELEFEKGIPVALNNTKMKLSDLIDELNQVAGKHGVGVVQMVEDRLVGVKNGGVYELPAGHVIIEAHKALEKYVNTRELNELKSMMDIKWGYLCYGAKWFDPVMDAINAFNIEVNKKVTGKVKVKLFKGSAIVVAMESQFGLANASFSNSEGYKFNVNASAGFTEIYTLQMKIANQMNKLLLINK